MAQATEKQSAPDVRTSGETSGTYASASTSAPKSVNGSATIVDGPGQTGLNERDIGLIEQRGLDPEILSDYGVRSSNRLGGSVAIPYFVNGVVVNHKYRRIFKADNDRNFEQDGGAQKCFWNQDVLTDESLKDEPLIVTEGEFDAFSAIQAGYIRTVSVPDGAPAQSQEEGGAKYSYVDDALGLLRDVKEIVLCADGDGPGSALLNDLSHRLGRARCKWVKYPKGCKDLNDALREYGQKGVQETIRRADFIKVDGVYRMSELPPIPPKTPHDPGIPGLEGHYKLRKGDLAVVTGIPSHGKTTLVNAMCCRLAELHGWRTVWASFEQEPQTDHRRALRTFFNRKLEVEQSEEERDQADQWIDRYFSFVVPSEDDDVSLEWAEERLVAAIIQHGADVAVIDPWNEMDHDRPPNMTETEYTGFAIKRFKKIARKYQVHLIVVAHPAKMRKNEDGTYPVPSLYDISGSANWYNKPDVGLVVHRYQDHQLARVAKSRYHEQIGKPGDVKLVFSMNTGRYDRYET